MGQYRFFVGMTLMSLVTGGLSACSNGNGPAQGDMSNQPPADMNPGIAKAVYTLSNDTVDNKIYVYRRAADGSLTALNSFSTGGKGTATGLGDQNSLIFDSTQNLFFAVNAGDNSISMLGLDQAGTPDLLSHVPSGGRMPVSIAVYGSLVYVVNAGDETVPMAGNISGFKIMGNNLVPIPNSTMPLSIENPGPAQIQFTPDGTRLVVTERTTKKIDTYTIEANTGLAKNPLYQNSVGTTPFGFAFSANQQLIVSEAAAPGAASSYSIAPNGTLTTITGSLVSGQKAPCWVTVVRNTAYVTNAQSNNISAYSIATNGALGLLSNGVSGLTGMGATDEDATDDGDFLYVLNARDDSFSYFAINSDGSLTKKGDFPGVPSTAIGIVAR